MPAGGTWVTQNKRRPGAYINYKAIKPTSQGLSDRGIIAVGLPLSWGPEGKLITLYGTDLLDGSSLAKVGATAYTDNSLPFRLALRKCHTALIWNTNTGGTKATSEITDSNTTATAKYPGTLGNNITVTIVENKPETGKTTVQVLYNNLLQESFVVKSVEEFVAIDSKWVEFTCSAGSIPATAGVKLSGGEDGTDSKDYSGMYKALSTENWNCLAISGMGGDSGSVQTFEKQILSYRNDLGKKIQGVCYMDVEFSEGKPAAPYTDSEAIVAVRDGYVTGNDHITKELFPVLAASLTAGAQVFESNTALVLEEYGAQIDDPVDANRIAEALELGWFILSYRQDGAICVEQDINTLRTFGDEKNYSFTKNRVIRTIDLIGNDISLLFNKNYCGKVSNNEENRTVFKSEIINIMNQLQDLGAIQNFLSVSDISVMQGDAIDAVVVDLYVQPVDSMEKLYMTVYLNS